MLCFSDDDVDDGGLGFVHCSYHKWKLSQKINILTIFVWIEKTISFLSINPKDMNMQILYDNAKLGFVKDTGFVFGLDNDSVIVV